MFFSKNFLYLVIVAVIPKLTTGVDFVAKKEKLSVKQGAQAILEWQCNFLPPSGNEFVHVYFQAPNNQKETDTLATIFNRNAQVNQKNTHFKNKIQVTMQIQSNSFVFFIEIANTGRAEEGKYIIQRNSIDGSVSSREFEINLEVIVPPSIQKTPKEIEKLERQDVSFPCIAIEGNPKPLTFKWYFKRVNSSANVAVTDEVKEYDRYYYNISNIDYTSVGEYECVVTNGHGDKDTFKINLRVKHAPYILIPPINTTVFESDGIESMDCAARGNPPTQKYHWYEGQNLVEIKQSTKSIKIENGGARLRFENPSRSLATKYSCAGENEYGTGTPKGAYLNVTYIPESIEIPTAVNNVVNGDEGTNITVKCYSMANPPATYSWSRRIQSRGTTREEKIGEDNQTGELTIYNAFLNDTGEYKCTAFNFPNPSLPKKIFIEEKTIQIKVNYGPLRTNITVNGYNQSHIQIEVEENTAVEIKCESDSEPPALYNIKYGNTQMNPDVKIGLYRIAALTIPNEGDYTCVASNSVLNTVQVQTIKVLVAIKPSVVEPIPIAQQTINERETVKITCHAKGRPAPKVFWTKEGKNITSFNDGVITSSYNVIPGQPGDREFKIEASLTFTGIRSTDEGNYMCIIYNGAGRVDGATKYIVNYAPKFLQPLQNFTVPENGNAVTFFCSVEGKPNNNILYNWFVNGKQISITESKLMIGIPKRDSNGKYQCEAKNTVGASRSTIGNLMVTYPPKITNIKINGDSDDGGLVVINVKASLELLCEAEGVPEPTFQWTKEGDTNFKIDGNIVRITEVNSNNKGNYFCNVQNADGRDSKSVKVGVRHKPIIVSESPAETKLGISVGMTAHLDCDAEGFPIPDIKWKEQGATSLLVDGVGDYVIKSVTTDFGIRSKLSFTVQPKHLGMQFICTAMNSQGEDDQNFQVLQKGKPEPPISITATDKLLPVFPIIVNVTLKWVPGFNGGHPVTFILKYKETNQFVDSNNFLEQYIGDAPQNTYVFQNRKPGTMYEFALVARNMLGISSQSDVLEFTTKAAPEPVATFEVKRRDDTSVIIAWVINKKPVEKASRKRRATELFWDYGLIRYRALGTGALLEEKISDIPQNGTYVVKDLDPSQTYVFYFVLYDTSGDFATPVSGGNPISPGGEARTGNETGLSKTDIIAIAVGCGGTILILIIIILFIAIHRRAKSNKAKHNAVYNPRVRVDLPVSTIKSGYSDVVRTSYMNGEDEDPFAMDTTVIDDNHDKSPPDYNSVHHYADPPPNRDYNDHPPSSFRPSDDPTPSYTSFGRIPKKAGNARPADNKNHSKSMTSLSGPRSAEISRGNEQNRYSLDNLDEYPARDASDPLIQKSKNDRNSKSKRNSRGRLSSDEDLPEPPPFMKDALRSPPSDEGRLNRAPGAFGDRNGRFKKPQPKTYDEPPPPPNGIHQGVRSNSPAPSSVASSKPYRSDNEYIDDQDDKYVGYLV